ncbi:MAG: hypothetical protein IPL62_06450 [Caulobacteraceae bacterium]|nr:hypothetical protein [Caulobacteraceae bacterium]
MVSWANKSLTRKLARIVECSRLLDLSRDDTLFSNSGGEIIYAADTNFIQAFLQPSAWRRCSRLFHHFGIWERTPKEETWAEGPPSLERVIASQATFLATEFAFAQAKHSKRGLLMSPAHQQECADQIDFLRTEFAKHLSAVADHQREQARRILEYAESKLSVEKLRAQGSLWTGDLDFGKMRPPELERAWTNYINASIYRIVADDDFTEPRDQVRRLQSDELWCIQGLNSEFPLERGQEMELSDQTEFWYGLLCEERAMHKDYLVDGESGADFRRRSPWARRRSARRNHCARMHRRSPI